MAGLPGVMGVYAITDQLKELNRVMRGGAKAEAQLPGSRALVAQYLLLLEGSEDAWSTASGMAAVFWSLAALLEQGDRVVASRDLFGSCFVILDELLPRWGIRTEFVNGAALEEWEQALATPAAAVFFESPSNPMQGLVDVAAVSELSHAAGAMVVG